MNSLLRRSNSMILKNNAVSHKLSITTAPAKAWISNRGPGAVFWLLYTDVFILVRSTFCFLDNNFIVDFLCWIFYSVGNRLAFWEGIVCITFLVFYFYSYVPPILVFFILSSLYIHSCYVKENVLSVFIFSVIL